MKIYTLNEIKTWLNDNWASQSYVSLVPEQGYDIELCAMYGYPQFNVEDLFKLCEFFDTLNINESRYSQNGCATCDYGSRYVLVFQIRDGKKWSER